MHCKNHQRLIKVNSYNDEYTVVCQRIRKETMTKTMQIKLQSKQYHYQTFHTVSNEQHKKGYAIHKL